MKLQTSQIKQPKSNEVEYKQSTILTETLRTAILLHLLCTLFYTYINKLI